MFLFTMRQKTKRFSTHNCNTYCSSNRLKYIVTLYLQQKKNYQNKEQFIAEVQKQMPAGLIQLCTIVKLRKTPVILGDKTFN